jgi:hypothetical protein
MATTTTKPYAVVLGAEDFVLGENTRNSVSRWRVHVTAIAGTVTVKGKLHGDTAATRVAVAVAEALGAGTFASTITATGVYDLDSSGLDLVLSSDTSCTFSYVALIG